MAEDTAQDSGSTVPRRQLGRHLRQLREETGTTVRATVAEMEWSAQKLWRIETGKGPVRVMDVKNLCELYGADQRTTEALMALAKETKNRGWWHTYGKTVPEWFELYVGLEAAASHIRWYDSEVVTGLLQTSRYADALVGVSAGRPATKEERARRVEVRTSRQALLTRRVPKPPKLDVILGEEVLLRSPSDTAIMIELLQRLLDVSRMRHVTLRVLPIAAGLHPGLDCGGRFAILEFPPARNGQREPSVVYSESLTGAWYGDDPDEVAAYDRVWKGMEAASLPPGESRMMITSLLERYEQR
jgi:hypothetical protein